MKFEILTTSGTWRSDDNSSSSCALVLGWMMPPWLFRTEYAPTRLLPATVCRKTSTPSTSEMISKKNGFRQSSLSTDSNRFLTFCFSVEVWMDESNIVVTRNDIAESWQPFLNSLDLHRVWQSISDVLQLQISRGTGNDESFSVSYAQSTDDPTSSNACVNDADCFWQFSFKNTKNAHGILLTYNETFVIYDFTCRKPLVHRSPSSSKCLWV